MKLPKSEPYQRSRHRAALHAWVVAATAVASVGLPSAALAMRSRHEQSQNHVLDTLTPAQAAQRTAGDWLGALRDGDVDSALSMMRLPRLPELEQEAMDHAAALSNLISQSGATIEPVACRSAGHWALSAWRLDVHDSSTNRAGLIEPITLYNPVGDGLLDSSAAWEVVPQGLTADPALAPLYNTDHDELIAWYRSIEQG